MFFLVRAGPRASYLSGRPCSWLNMWETVCDTWVGDSDAPRRGQSVMRTRHTLDSRDGEENGKWHHSHYSMRSRRFRNQRKRCCELGGRAKVPKRRGAELARHWNERSAGVFFASVQVHGAIAVGTEPKSKEPLAIGKERPTAL